MHKAITELGHQHFSATHEKVYENLQCGERVEVPALVHMNQIEGAWKHAKQHFRKINGSTSITNCEAHLSEINSVTLHYL